jgi:hypothetical protein
MVVSNISPPPPLTHTHTHTHIFSYVLDLPISVLFQATIQNKRPRYEMISAPLEI